MRPLMRGAGHEFFTPSYTGLGERAHLATRGVDLRTHIADVLGTLTFEDLRDVILIGHSYGGVVATGVAANAPERIRSLVYLDAFVPRSGQCALDLLPATTRNAMLEVPPTAEGGIFVPPAPLPPDTAPEDMTWATPLRRPQPIETLRQVLDFDEARLPQRAYIYCTRIPPGDPFGPSAERARREGWAYFELDASHNPHITVPERLLDVLEKTPGVI